MAVKKKIEEEEDQNPLDSLLGPIKQQDSSASIDAIIAQPPEPESQNPSPLDIVNRDVAAAASAPRHFAANPFYAAVWSTGHVLNFLDSLNPHASASAGQPLIDWAERGLEGLAQEKHDYEKNFDTRLAFDTGEAIAMTALAAVAPGMGLARGAQPGAQALGQLNPAVSGLSGKVEPFGRSVIEKALLAEQYAQKPLLTTLLETTAGAGAGAGASIAETLYPENPAAQLIGGMAGGLTVGGTTALLTRVGPWKPEIAAQIVEDALKTTQNGRLPGKTLEETLAYQQTLNDIVNNEKVHARNISDQFLIENYDAAAGPLFQSADLEAQLRMRLKNETEASPDTIEDNVRYVMNEIERGDPKIRSAQELARSETKAGQIDNYFEASIAEGEKDRQKWAKEVIRNVRDMQSAKRDQLGKLGPLGREAQISMSLERGATPKAEIEVTQYRKEIFNGLSTRDMNTFSKMLMAIRGSQVESARPLTNQARRAAGEREQGAFLNKEWLEGDYNDALKMYMEDLGPVKSDDMYLRAVRYFGAFQNQLEKLNQEGLISKTELDRLSRFVYQPKQFFDGIDPELEPIIVGDKKFSVNASGIKRLEGGNKDFIQMSPEQLLAQAVVRTESRITRNRTGNALFDVAKSMEDNGLVSTKKQEGWVKFTARRLDEKGEATNVSYYAEPELARVLLEEEAPEVGKILPLLAGTRVAKGFITGANPLFILRQFPRDIAFATMTTGEYNRYVYPKGLFDMATDIIAVSKDAFKREGLYKEYIDNYGGMSFLSHSARLSELKNPAKTQFGEGVREALRALTYINETSEIMMRLAVMRRAKINGKSAREAAFIARDYLDFSDGTPLTKAADKVFSPYLNVQYVANRNFFKAAKNDPAAFTTALGWTVGAFGSAAMFAWMSDPETMRAVSPRQREGNIIIPLGIKRVDAAGNVRYGYLAIPIDQTMIPLKKVTDGLIDSYVTGEEPDMSIAGTLDTFMKTYAPNGWVPPSVGAVAALGNVDAGTWHSVWSKDDRAFSEEIKRLDSGDPTSALARDMGKLSEIVGLGDMPISSPERLEAIAKSFGMTQNDWATMFAGTYGILSAAAGHDETMKDLSWQAQIQLFPNLRLYKETHPLDAQIDQLRRDNRKAQTPEAVARDKLREQISLNLNNDKRAMDRKDILKLAKSFGESDMMGPFPGAMVGQLQDYVINEYERQQIWRTHSVPPELMAQSDIGYIATLHPSVAARWFYNEEQRMDLMEGDQKRNYRKFLGTLRARLPGFHSQEFNQWLGKYEREEGE